MTVKFPEHLLNKEYCLLNVTTLYPISMGHQVIATVYTILAMSTMLQDGDI